MAASAPISSALSVCVLLSASAALAAPSATLSPTTGHPKITVQVSGSGFGASEAVDVYFDTTDVLLGVTNASGAFATYALKIPADAAPGTHWITLIGRKSGDAAQKAFVERTDWLQYGFTGAGQHRNPYENVLSPASVSGLTLAWSVPANAAQSAPAVYGGVVYVGGASGNFYTLNAATGALKWKKPQCTTTVGSAPALAGGMVYFGCYGDNKLYAYAASNGALKWSQDTQGLLSYSSPAVAKGIVYIASADGILHAYNATSGAPVWAQSFGGPLSSPAVANGIVYLGAGTGTIWALDAATGGAIWSNAASSGTIQAITVANNMVYAGASDDYLYALNAASGAVNWRYNMGGEVAAAPAFWNGAVYAGVYGGGGIFVALSAGSGKLLWSTTTGQMGASAVNAANGVVYLTTVDGRVLALDAANGEELWDAAAGNGFNTPPVIADGVLYVGSALSGDPNLHAFALGGGDAAVYHRTATPPPFASLHPDHRLKQAPTIH